MKRIVDEQYQRGMKLLRVAQLQEALLPIVTTRRGRALQDNMYLLDTLAKTLMEEEKVSGHCPSRSSGLRELSGTNMRKNKAR